MANLTAVGTFPGRTRGLLDRRLRRPVIPPKPAKTRRDADPLDLLLHLLLLLALLGAFAIPLETFLLFAGPVRNEHVSQLSWGNEITNEIMKKIMNKIMNEIMSEITDETINEKK